MRNAGTTVGLVLLLLLAGCYQNAGQTGQQESQLPSSVATFTPQAAGLPVTALAAADTDPSPAAPSAADDEAAQQVIDPLNLTATAIVARATMTQAALDGLPVAATLAPVVTPAVPGASATPAAVRTEAPSDSAGDCIHVVQAADRGLSNIAALYGVSLADIQQANNLANVELIHVGNELVIPGCGTTGFRQSAAPGESCRPESWSQVHTVRAGENLYRIALSYNVDMDQLALLNCIPDPTLIRVGQLIYIP